MRCTNDALSAKTTNFNEKMVERKIAKNSNELLMSENSLSVEFSHYTLACHECFSRSLSLPLPLSLSLFLSHSLSLTHLDLPSCLSRNLSLDRLRESSHDSSLLFARLLGSGVDYFTNEDMSSPKWIRLKHTQPCTDSVEVYTLDKPNRFVSCGGESTFEVN